MKYLVSLLVLLVFTLNESPQTLPTSSQLGCSNSSFQNAASINTASINTASLIEMDLDVAAADSATAFIGHKRLDREISDHYGNPEGFTHYIIRVPPIFV